MEDCKKNNKEMFYTPREEFFNALTHALGALFGIYAIVMLPYYSVTVAQKATTAFYGAMLFILFEASTCYHAVTNEKAKRVLRKIDHSAIYLLIAGTYTPILILVLKEPYSIIWLAVIWYLAITGIVFSCITLKFEKLSTALYIIMGWMSLFLFYYMLNKGLIETIIYLTVGGVLYSIGCFFYVSEKKYYHTIWHIFVLLGAIAHYLSIMALLSNQ